MWCLSLTKHHAVTVVGRWGTAPHILNFSTRLMWTVSFTVRLPYPSGNTPWYLTDRRRDGPQSRFGCYRDKKDAVLSNKCETPIPRSSSTQSELSRLSLGVVDQTKRFHVVSPMQFSFTLHCKPHAAQSSLRAFEHDSSQPVLRNNSITCHCKSSILLK
jgi:hypothetical protein